MRRKLKAQFSVSRLGQHCPSVAGFWRGSFSLSLETWFHQSVLFVEMAEDQLVNPL